MNLLVAVMTCHELDYYIDDLTVDWCTQQGLRCTDQQARVNTIRDTWLRELPAVGVDYKFFYGTKLRDKKRNQRVPTKFTLREPLADEVYLSCGDNYVENPAKMKAICQWAIDHKYNYILRCDDDTFVYPERLILDTDWDSFDYSGACATGDFHPGGCMFLSRRMMDLVIDAPVTNYADDVWIGEVARNNPIPTHHIPTMRNQWGTGYKVPIDINPTGIASFHSCTPDVMRRLYVAGQTDRVTRSAGTQSPSVSI